MNKFYLKSFLFWFVLLVTAILNAGIREATYKPLLTPFIGNWAHQISSLTGIFLFFGVIYLFLKNTKEDYNKKSLAVIGVVWFIMTFIFEIFMNIFLRKLSFEQVLQTYYFWQGETWIFVLLSVLVLPMVIGKILKKY